MTLGENIARLRAEKRLSQGDLADALGVSRQSVSKWETDASVPELDKLVRLSELFGVTLDRLVKGEAADEEPKQEVCCGGSSSCCPWSSGGSSATGPGAGWGYGAPGPSFFPNRSTGPMPPASPGVWCGGRPNGRRK